MLKLSYLAASLAAVSVCLSTPVVAQSRLAPPAGTPMSASHLNPNTATEAQLRAIPAISAELRAAIIAGRPYATPAAFHRVVSAKATAAQTPAIYAAVWAPINLNTASKEEIALIPGMSPRMIHEFEEYRPYKDMAQFNREIGKYVDATEVARLASYVTVR